MAPGRFRTWAVLVVLAPIFSWTGTGLFPLCAADPLPPGFKAYPTPCYTIYTDLDLDTVREAAARMTAMALEYQARTSGFSRKVRSQLPFYLYANSADYYKAGGLPGSTGMFSGDKLMAIASKDRGSSLWRVVQHEGFHQYAHAVLSSRLPVWVNEGLAEYFGYGVWTGDTLVTGVIPPGQLKEVRQMIRDNKVVPFLQMLVMDNKTWTVNLKGSNYTQAWSMVHFLAHAENGKYQPAFNAFIVDISAGRPWKDAFLNRFGNDVEAFQKRYADWWTALPDNPTQDKYTEATVLTLTSFLARAQLKKQSFEDSAGFFDLAARNKLEIDPALWLPPSLLAQARDQASRLGAWSLEKSRSLPRLVLTDRQGATFTGSFAFATDRIVTQCTVTPPEPPDQKD